MLRQFLILLVLLSTAFVVSAQNPPDKSGAKRTITERMAKLVAPWPDDDTLRNRHNDAEGRAMFRSADPLKFVIESDFTAVNKDRDPDSTKRFPAVLKIAGDNGQERSISLNIGARGHLRRMSSTCSFVPLRLEFSGDAAKDTAFEGPARALKLVTHCQASQDHEQYVLREYLAYQLAKVLMPHSFRARLAKVTYKDSKSAKVLTERYGLILEDDGDVARRMEGRVVAQERTSFKDLDAKTLSQMMVFQYMLGNTDFSIYALHNVVLVQMPSKVLHPVPYDFDLSGLVNPPYAQPAPRLGIKTVVERAYRGPCLTEQELQPILLAFHAKRAEVLAAADTLVDLNTDTRREIKAFLSDFYSTIERPAAMRRAFISGCKRTTM